ncbi:hypothetical protein ACKWTF_009411 [Chironomus riparius]
MEKIFLLMTCLVFVFGDLPTQSSIKCNYELRDKRNSSEFIEYATYKCEVINNPRINNKESAKISIINRIPDNLNATYDNVITFDALNKIIVHIPQDLGKHFKNIENIYIQSCHLKELDKTDLKQFQNLRILSLKYNDIEVIEDGLFDFNSKLEIAYILEQNSNKKKIPAYF